MAGSRYQVRVSKDYLVFSSGHFITYGGGLCERVHGHNYRVAVEIEDRLDENHYVFDFIALKDLTREIVDEIDHRMLLPTASAPSSCSMRMGRTGGSGIVTGSGASLAMSVPCCRSPIRPPSCWATTSPVPSGNG